MGVFESSAYQRTVHLPQAERGHPLLRWRKEHNLAPPVRLTVTSAILTELLLNCMLWFSWLH